MENNHHNELGKVTHVSGMFKNWFIDYASYVILERAIPALEDGLKPVQRRILHSMWELEDGRYNKVANLIGNTMKYHPHGDASIGDALVSIGQKDLLIDCQGNWGNILTGDSAAAPRYIEARLSKFGQEVLFNPKTTNWGVSYDGRNKEPITLPVKFPLLLAQGVEGIAVGLATKILPHNFNELIDASIQILKGKNITIYPDFITKGIADFTDYKDGMRGGKVKIRARIKELNFKTLCVTEIPFGTTTGTLIDSILAANDKGKIKIKKIEDNTAEQVEILIHLLPGTSPDKTIDALYAFTNCEMSISPNACIIENQKPKFIGVSEILKLSTHQTVELLKKELEIELHEFEEKWHFASLEKLFIKHEMYIDFKKYNTKENLFEYLYECFRPHKKKFIRAIEDADLNKLIQIPMVRITRFDSTKADETLKDIELQIELVKNNLNNLVNYAIEYFKNLKKKYGQGKERKTETKQLETIIATQVIMANEKIYVNREEGFIGKSLKKDEFVADCSDLDEIIAFTKSGTMKVCKVADKTFIGKDIIHVAVFKKNDDKTTYNMIYTDGPKGVTFIKRFNVVGITRDKEYDLTKGTVSSTVYWFSANQNTETEILNVILKPATGIRKLEIEVDFSEVPVKNRTSIGNIVTKYGLKKVVLKLKNEGQIKSTKIWYNNQTQRLNIDGVGKYLGKFMPEDKIMSVTQLGYYKISSFDLITHFDGDTCFIEKFNSNITLSCIYFDGESESHFTKRFLVELINSKTRIISEHEHSKIEIISSQPETIVHASLTKQKDNLEKPDYKINLDTETPVVSIKAKGKKLSVQKIKVFDLQLSEEIKNAQKFQAQYGDSDLSPMDLHQKALEKLNVKNLKDEKGQIDFGF